MIFKKKNSDQNIFTPDFLYFQFSLRENVYLTPIWSIFTRYDSSSGHIKDSSATNQSNFFILNVFISDPPLYIY